MDKDRELGHLNLQVSALFIPLDHDAHQHDVGGIRILKVALSVRERVNDLLRTPIDLNLVPVLYTGQLPAKHLNAVRAIVNPLEVTEDLLQHSSTQLRV